MSKDLCVGKAYVFPDESNPFDKLVAEATDVMICKVCGSTMKVQQMYDALGVPVKGIRLICPVCEGKNGE